MALLSGGTVADDSLDALVFTPGGMTAANVAAFALKVKNDINPAHPIWPGAFSNNGLLFVPNRGVLKMLPGDVVMVDEFGWPILVSYGSIASGTTDWVTA